jgi:hypothetical protein
LVAFRGATLQVKWLGTCKAIDVAGTHGFNLCTGG